MSPEYLRELIPPTVGERQPYNLRSNRNITHVLARRQGLSRSFFPTVIREWNSLPVEIRLAETLHGFSKSLDALYPSLPKRSWFSMGERIFIIREYAWVVVSWRHIYISSYQVQSIPRRTHAPPLTGVRCFTVVFGGVAIYYNYHIWFSSADHQITS